MKRFFLVILISSSFGLHGFNGVPTGIPTGIPTGVSAAANAAASAQTYGQSDSAIAGSTESQISTNMTQLNHLIPSMEKALCGPGGMDSCIGGITGDYNRWKNFVDSKYDPIEKYSNQGDYHAGTELCKKYVSPYVSDYIIGTGSSAHLSFMPVLNDVMSNFTTVMGTVNSSGAITSPGLLRKTVDLLSYLGSAIKIDEILDVTTDAKSAIDASNTSNDAFNACMKEKTAGINCDDNPLECCFLTKKCGQEMMTYLSDLEKVGPAKVALYEKLLLHQLYDQGYPSSKTIKALLMKCILPGKCAACKEPSTPIPSSCKNPSFIGSCDYTVPTYTIGDGTQDMNYYLNKFATLASSTNTFVSKHDTQLQHLEGRTSAIGKKLKELSDGIKSTSNRMKSLLDNCSTDEKDYAAEVKEIMEVTSIFVGLAVGCATVEFGGFAAGPLMKGLLMVATMVPPIANFTINPVVDFISLDISDAVADDEDSERDS